MDELDQGLKISVSGPLRQEAVAKCLGQIEVWVAPQGKAHSFTGVGVALMLELSQPCGLDDNYFADRSIPIGGNYDNQCN